MIKYNRVHEDPHEVILQKVSRVEEGAKNFGIFRVKNHDFTPKNDISSNCGGRRENIWGISCEKSRFYAKKEISQNFSPLPAPLA
jgi:hypothetical protein